ncbi:hypothetical protein EUGRSUZ_G00753 [Eucalyptus grandis]|uniref:Uncharacterized protein n=2 Tax=Eucalyptus grandis TaxID=71139 RepID=A0ACC3K0W0_EUCGR|nr:hypothetical protein EUGRSUZ_G00753 [Eucalyptus grandis]
MADPAGADPAGFLRRLSLREGAVEASQSSEQKWAFAGQTGKFYTKLWYLLLVLQCTSTLSLRIYTLMRVRLLDQNHDKQAGSPVHQMFPMHRAYSSCACKERILLDVC